MAGFLRPLRRRIAAATLALACVFMVAWVRSLQADDMIRFNGLLRRHYFRSVDGSLIWRSWELSRPERDSWSLKASWTPGPPLWKSFEYYTLNGKRIPYGSIVIPLIMLSSYLLLSKPHQVNLRDIFFAIRANDDLTVTDENYMVVNSIPRCQDIVLRRHQGDWLIDLPADEVALPGDILHVTNAGVSKLPRG